MRFLLLPLLWIAGIATAHALDTITQGLVISGYVTTQVTTAPFDRKLISAARDDAAVFVATDGRVRGARLEAALEAIRVHKPARSASDLELARAILVE